ncbi:MAG: PadR family transcriptional regulator [Promethearchaeota archaeon]|nr:MAG: PadR family transcriptional regulator [Candidatus Lokiarchaeota archaeon]
MTQNNDINKIENIVDSFDNAMKKGFVSGLILVVLEKERGHGYKIAEEIDELTDHVFQPTVSTLYPLLRSLNEKGLIDCIEVDDSGRQKKVYEITSKGKETLKMIIQKHQIMTESIKSIILSALDITDVTEPSFLEEIERLISYPGMELIKSQSTESKKEIMEYHKELLERRIEILQKNLETVKGILIKLEKKRENGDIDHSSNNSLIINNKYSGGK